MHDGTCLFVLTCFEHICTICVCELANKLTLLSSRIEFGNTNLSMLFQFACKGVLLDADIVVRHRQIRFELNYLGINLQSRLLTLTQKNESIGI